ncbi:ChrR family anti-sigma-E factor [Vibrio ostreicida]|uniref:ChrR family anti-sigma-E factor n=1 Tax=Vibrio ostreicida TaxID=526588 RepID=A0ABT8BRB6_9VIBR|nr:ChrR family anti-sigma-E factor [Vibrio ostreicida]MDN3609204.1 ChrR family anti-sigma-E factor [Vibrio ostreicida]NPD08096.1 transcriptional regulator [Vibrio ostreicida]
MSHHPEYNMLRAYVEGELDAVDGFSIATHLESCPDCKGKVAELEAQYGEKLCALEGESDRAFSAMLDNILAADTLEINVNRRPSTIEVGGKIFQLPRSLTNLRHHIGHWKSYGGKVFSAPIDLGENCRVNLLYISEGVRIPQHTHKGIESTLVLHGGFCDEDGEYEVGDYLVKDASIKHSPYTRAGEDCLCMTILTEPMVFTQGVARMFNMFGKGLYP